MFIIISLLFGWTSSYSQSSKANDTISVHLHDSVSKKTNTKSRELIYTKANSTSKTFELSAWQKGFISGLVGTLIGFIFTMAWDIYKNKRDKSEKDRVVKKLIKDVLSENLVFIKRINEVLEQEMVMLNQNQSIIQNVTTLKNDFWDLIKFHIPKNLLKNNDLLKRLQDISGSIKVINECINSRELYRINSEPMNNFKDRLRFYDKIIFNANEKLEILITSFLKDY